MRPLPNIELWKGPNILLIKCRIYLGVVENRRCSSPTIQIAVCHSADGLQVSPLQGCIFRLKCSYPELTKDHVLTSAYVKFFRTVTRNAVNNSAWRKKDCSWLPLNKHALNIFIWAQFSENQSMVLQEPEHGSLRIRAHLSWRTGKHLHVLHVLRTYSMCSYPGY